MGRASMWPEGILKLPEDLPKGVAASRDASPSSADRIVERPAAHRGGVGPSRQRAVGPARGAWIGAQKGPLRPGGGSGFSPAAPNTMEPPEPIEEYLTMAD